MTDMRNQRLEDRRQTTLRSFESYPYLGQRYSTRDKNQHKAIQRRITAGWTAYAMHHDIFKGNIGTSLKKQVYNICILPVMIYGVETWAATSQAKNRLGAAQTKTERRNINQISRFLPRPTKERVVNAVITSRLDYYSALLYGTSAVNIARLQRIKTRLSC